MAVGKHRGQRPAKAGSVDFSMRSIERRKALQEGYPTADRERPRTAAEMGRAVGFSGDDADMIGLIPPAVTNAPRLPARLLMESQKTAREHGKASKTDLSHVEEMKDMKRKLGLTRGTRGSSAYE